MNAVQRYICGRLASALPVLFGVSLLAFGLGQLSPGDPAEIMLEGTGMGMPSAEEVAALRSYLGLDQPWYAQYGLWLRRLLHGDGGMSYHLGYVLPSLALALVTLAMTAQLLDSQLRGALSSFYARVARLRGLSEGRVLLVYALPNAMLPVAAMLGNFFAAVLGGAIVVETVFALPGIGSLALDAIHYRDYPLLQGYVLFLGAIYVLVTLAVDLLLARMDPRILPGGER